MVILLFPNGFFSEIQTGNDCVQLSKMDFEAFKQQLHKAEQCAAHLDAESNYWQSQLVQLKQKAHLIVGHKSEAVESLKYVTIQCYLI